MLLRRLSREECPRAFQSADNAQRRVREHHPAHGLKTVDNVRQRLSELVAHGAIAKAARPTRLIFVGP